MLGLILDTFILIILVRVITGDEEEGFLKPGIIAFLAALALFGVGVAADSVEINSIFIIIGGILIVAVLVAVGCIALMGVDPKSSAIVGGAYAGYKIATIFLLTFLFST